MNNTSLRLRRFSSRGLARAGRSLLSARSPLAVSVASLLLLQGSAKAGNFYWTVSGGGTWNSGNNWTATATGGAAAGAFPTSLTADFAIFNTTILNSPETITLDANQSAAGMTFNNTGTTSIIGSTAGATPYTLTLGSSVSINAGAGAVSIGGGNMTVITNGSSTFTNNSSSLFSITSNISVGTSTSGSQLAIGGTGDTTISGSIGNSTNVTPTVGALVKGGTGTLTLTGTSTYTGQTSAVGGILRIDANAGGSLATTAQVNLGGGTLALLGKSSAATTQALGVMNLTAGTSSGLAVDGGTSTSTALNVTTFTQGAGSSVNITTANGGIVSTTQTNTVGIIGSHVLLNGNDFAVSNGAGNAITAVTTTPLNTATTTDTLNSNVTAGATLSTGKTTNSLTVRTDGTPIAIGSGNTLTLTSGALLFTGTSDSAITGGTLRGANTTELVASQYSTGNVTISSIIAGGAFTKTGPGAMTISGNNINTGAVYVSQGSLTIAGDNSSATGGVNLSGVGVTLNLNTATALGSGTFNINQTNTTTTLPVLNNTSGSAVTSSTSGATTVSGSFVFGTSANTAANNLTLGTGLTTLAVNPLITLNGASTLGFGGALTVGVTPRILTVNNGVNTTAATTLTMNGIVGTSAAANGSTATTFNGSGNIKVTGPIVDNANNLSSTLGYSGTGSLTIAGANNSYTGGLGVSSGTLNLNSATAPGTGTLSLGGGTIDNTSGAALALTSNNGVSITNSFGFSTAAGTANNNLTIPGAVSLPANRTFTLNGAGALTFSGVVTNTLTTGGRTIPVNNGAGTTATTVLNLGGFVLTSGTAPFSSSFNGTGSVNITGLVTDGTATTTGSGFGYGGSGRLTLSNPTGNNYTGATTINGANGTFVVSNTSGSATGGGAVALGSGTANSPAILASGAGNVGIITGTVTTTGKTTATISPGGAGTVGMLTLTNLTATAGTTFAFDLGASSGGTSSDVLTLNGTLAATTSANTGNLAFSFTNNGVTPNTTYTLISYVSATGLDLGDLSATGVTGSFNISSATGPGVITFTTTPVPEPRTWVAGMLAAAVLVMRARRSRRSKAA